MGKRRQWNLKEETLYGTVLRTRFGRGYGTVARQDYAMNEVK